MSSDYENVNMPQTMSVRVQIAEQVFIANARVLPARRVPLTAALKVADRVLARSSHTDVTARAFAVERAVTKFIALATLGPRTGESVEHLDLLPVAHPLSTAPSALTASALSDARAEWLAADPRITDELRPLVASAYTMEFGSVERVHALARLEAAAGEVPLDLIALVADGNSSAARSARARRQLRDRLKRFAFEGGMGGFLVRIGDKVKDKVGALVGGSATTGVGEVYITEDDEELGLKKGDILPIKLDNYEGLDVMLTEEQLKKAGVKLPSSKVSSSKRAQDIKELLANKLEAPSDWKKLPNGDFATEDGFVATPKGDLKYELKDENGNVVPGLEAAEWPDIQKHIKKMAEDEFGTGIEEGADSAEPEKTYVKKDLKVEQLFVGDLLPQYYPVKGAEANLLKKRDENPDFELEPTDEIIGTYKSSNPAKRGIKVRDLKTGKERYFEVNKTARIYDVRQKQADKPAEPKPKPELDIPEVLKDLKAGLAKLSDEEVLAELKKYNEKVAYDIEKGNTLLSPGSSDIEKEAVRRGLIPSFTPESTPAPEATKPVAKPAPKNPPSKKQREMIRSMLRERVMTGEQRQAYMDKLATVDKFGINGLFNELKELPKAKVALTDASDPLNQHENPALAKIKQKLAPFDLDGSIRRYIDQKTAAGEEVSSQEIRELLKDNKDFQDSVKSYYDYHNEGQELRSALYNHVTEAEKAKQEEATAKSKAAKEALKAKLDALKQENAGLSVLSKEEHQAKLQELAALISDEIDPDNDVRNGILNGKLRTPDEIIGALRKQEVKNIYKTMSPTKFASGYDYLTANEEDNPEEWAIIKAAYGLPQAPEDFERQFIANDLRGFDNENGDLANLINSGASGQEILDWLSANSENWAYRYWDWSGSWASDNPSMFDKAKWKAFGERVKRISDLGGDETAAEPSNVEFVSSVAERLPENTITSLDEELPKAFSGDSLSELLGKVQTEEDLERVVDELTIARASDAVTPEQEALLKKVQDAVIQKFYEDNPDLENTMSEPTDVIPAPIEAETPPLSISELYEAINELVYDYEGGVPVDLYEQVDEVRQAAIDIEDRREEALDLLGDGDKEGAAAKLVELANAYDDFAKQVELARELGADAFDDPEFTKEDQDKAIADYKSAASMARELAAAAKVEEKPAGTEEEQESELKSELEEPSKSIGTKVYTFDYGFGPVEITVDGDNLDKAIQQTSEIFDTPEMKQLKKSDVDFIRGQLGVARQSLMEGTSYYFAGDFKEGAKRLSGVIEELRSKVSELKDEDAKAKLNEALDKAEAAYNKAYSEVQLSDEPTPFNEKGPNGEVLAKPVKFTPPTAAEPELKPEKFQTERDIEFGVTEVYKIGDTVEVNDDPRDTGIGFVYKGKVIDRDLKTGDYLIELDDSPQNKGVVGKKVAYNKKDMAPVAATPEAAPAEQAPEAVENPYSTNNSDELLTQAEVSRADIEDIDFAIAAVLDSGEANYTPFLSGVTGNDHVLKNILDDLDASDGANSIALAGDLFTLQEALESAGVGPAILDEVKKLANAMDDFTPVADANDNDLLTIDTIKDEQDGVLDLSSWKKVGGQKGSNPGGTYENPETGEQVYVKTPKSQLHGENERLASALYDAAGISSAKVLKGKLADGTEVTYSPMIDGAKQDLKKNLKNKEYMARLQQGYALDALLANWDVIGLDYDNVVTDKNGEPVRVDPGGALLFRAQGSPKGDSFGEDVPELDAFTDKTSSRPSAKVFSQMTDEQKLSSAEVLQNLTPSKIDELVNSIITDPEKREELKTKLKARREFILNKFGLTDESEQKKEKNPAPGSSGNTKTLDVTGDIESLKDQLGEAIKNGDLVTFKYNGKERVIAPKYVWTNPKNGNINLTGDEGDVTNKNFTLQNFEQTNVTPTDTAAGEDDFRDKVQESTGDIEDLREKLKSINTFDLDVEDEANVKKASTSLKNAETSMAQAQEQIVAGDTEGARGLVEQASSQLIDAADYFENISGQTDEGKAVKELGKSTRGLAVQMKETLLGESTADATPAEAVTPDLGDENFRAEATKLIQAKLPDGYTASPEKGILDTGFVLVKNSQGETVAMVTMDPSDSTKFAVQNFKAGWKIETFDTLDQATDKLVDATKVAEEPGQVVQLSDGSTGKKGSKVVHSKNGITGTIVGFQKDPNYVKVKPDNGQPIKIMSINQIKSNGSGGEAVSAPEAPNAPEAPSAPEPEAKLNASQIVPQVSENMTLFAGPDGMPVKTIVIKTSEGKWDVIYDYNGPDFKPLHTDIESREEAEELAIEEIVNPASAGKPAKAAPTGPKKFTFDFMNLSDVTDAPEINENDPNELPGEQSKIKKDSTGALIKPGAIVKDENGRIGVYRTTGYGDPNKIRMIWEDGTQDSVMPDTVTATGKYLEPGIAGVYAGLADLDFDKKSEPLPADYIANGLADKNGKNLGYMQLVVDKNGDTGVLVEQKGKDGYVKVAFPDGMKTRKADTLEGLDSRYTKGEYNLKIAQKHYKQLVTYHNEKYNLPTFGTTVKSSKPAGKPGTITVPKNAAGASAQDVKALGWNESDFESIPSLEALLAQVTDTSVADSGLRGGSIALNSGSVEDLDLRIMAASGTSGEDAYLLKYKLTSWAGDELANKLVEMVKNNDPTVTVSSGLFVPENAIDGDKVSFTPSAYSDKSKYKSPYGETFVITQEDGTKIYFLRADRPTQHQGGAAKISSDGPRAYHNKVMIIAPRTSTPAQLASSLQTAGVQDVRPSTQGDAKVLIENRLMSIFDEKVDPKTNLSGKQREESLQRIKDKWGIGPENVTIKAGAGGRVEMRLDEESAKKIADKTKIKVLRHNLTGGSANKNASYNETEEEKKERIANYFVSRVASPHGGLLSTTTRWSEGVPTGGMSSQADIKTGGADYVFTTPVHGVVSKNDSIVPMIYFSAERAFQRLDFWANQSDQFGKRTGKSPIDQAVPGGYEVMFKGRLSFDDAEVLMVSDQTLRTLIITKLRQKGINEIGGRPLEAVIMTGEDYQALKAQSKN